VEKASRARTTGSDKDLSLPVAGEQVCSGHSRGWKPTKTPDDVAAAGTCPWSIYRVRLQGLEPWTYGLKVRCPLVPATSDPLAKKKRAPGNCDLLAGVDVGSAREEEARSRKRVRVECGRACRLFSGVEQRRGEPWSRRGGERPGRPTCRMNTTRVFIGRNNGAGERAPCGARRPIPETMRQHHRPAALAPHVPAPPGGGRTDAARHAAPPPARRARPVATHEAEPRGRDAAAGGDAAEHALRRGWNRGGALGGRRGTTPRTNPAEPWMA